MASTRDGPAHQSEKFNALLIFNAYCYAHCLFARYEKYIRRALNG